MQPLLATPTSSWSGRDVDVTVGLYSSAGDFQWTVPHRFAAVAADSWNPFPTGDVWSQMSASGLNLLHCARSDPTQQSRCPINAAE